MADLIHMQQCNLFNLPENYNMRYWMYHLMTWTHLPQVAVEEHSGQIVGYVLSKMEEENPNKKSEDFIPHGHITSISVLRDYRKLGIATKLMRATHHQMQTVYGAKYCSLHVRQSNRAALALYDTVLKYEIIDLEYEYYADREHAYDMCLFFDKSVRDRVIVSLKKEHAKRKAEKLSDQKLEGKLTDSAAVEDTAEESKEESEQQPMSKSQKKKQKKKNK